jgi:hypothetical protein
MPSGLSAPILTDIVAKRLAARFLSGSAVEQSFIQLFPLGGAFLFEVILHGVAIESINESTSGPIDTAELRQS